ncbi:hypothetical protein ACHHYP_04239 [Achlya hypogyna]|uniref:Transmembrane protein n=1 Tax=Achlya hypogyna TaxID=1202772 RepID=A0A1V9ZPD2_ACHHY|nr:hypothetical protein ACHHYP_04239 [Achlya hypogyna]
MSCCPSTPERTVREFPPFVPSDVLDAIERRRFVFVFLWFVLVVAPIVAAMYTAPGEYVQVPDRSTLFSSPLAWGTLVVVAIFVKFLVRYTISWPEARRIGPNYWKEMYGTMERHNTIGHYVRLVEYQFDRFDVGTPLEDMQSYYWTRWSIWFVTTSLVMMFLVWYNQITFSAQTAYLVAVVVLSLFTAALQFIYVQLPFYVELLRSPELAMNGGLDDERIPFATVL